MTRGDADATRPAIGGGSINQGPTATNAATLGLKAAPGGGFAWVERVESAPFLAGRLAVSRDGTTLTDLSRPAAVPGERQWAVYRRAGPADAR